MQNQSKESHCDHSSQPILNRVYSAHNEPLQCQVPDAARPRIGPAPALCINIAHLQGVRGQLRALQPKGQEDSSCPTALGGRMCCNEQHCLQAGNSWSLLHPKRLSLGKLAAFRWSTPLQAARS